ncbi:MAG: translation initiation factor IF-2, partial [Verrucomicrobia bacterium]
MSVRIYQLSKELNISNKELIELLKQKGLEVSSPSNTIPNIYADALLEEFKAKTTAPAAKETEEKPKSKGAKESTPPPPPSPSPEKQKFVKTADDIEQERQAVLEKKQTSAIISKPSAPPPLPSIPQVKTPPKAPVFSAQPPKLPQVTIPPRAPGPPLPKKEISAPESVEAEAPATQAATVIKCKPTIIVRDFAGLIGLKPFRLISELMEMGIFASMNQTIDEQVAIRIAKKHGFELEIQHRGEAQPQVQQQVKKPKEEPEKVVDETEFLKPRPPIVCVLGHVDHGKTTLLDTIRKTSVVTGEAGGITQHIGAYQVVHQGHKITFIDTPGHAAFSKMRQRGADVTDIAVLVVAADDGFKPQTDEALKFAQKANVPIVVAINKMDAPGANIDRVKQQLQERGIAPEDWGGETLTTPVSALKGTNIDALLELILLQAEISELKANPDRPAEGVIVESQIEVGRGPTASAIIEKGTLKIGDNLVCGGVYCKVRAMMDDKGGRLNAALPSTPVKILGWTDVPEAGVTFITVKNEKEAKMKAEEYAHKVKLDSLTPAKQEKMDLQNLLDAIAGAKEKILKVIIKADVHGSVEALSASLEAIKSDKIKLEVLYGDVGLINKNDVKNASASEAVIVAFNTKFETGTAAEAKHAGVQIIQHNIIYELIDRIKEFMTEMLEPELKENKLGAAEIRQVFAVSKGA